MFNEFLYKNKLFNEFCINIKDDYSQKEITINGLIVMAIKFNEVYLICQMTNTYFQVWKYTAKKRQVDHTIF